MSALHWPDHSGSHSRSDAKSNEDSQWAILDAYVPDVTLYIPFRAVIKESLYKSSDGNTEVYRVVLWLVNEDGIHDERVVVCKAAYGARCIDELKKEADIYQRLRALWGDVVPWLYGCYHGQTDSEGLTGVLVLEDCGTPMEHSLDCYSPTCRCVHGQPVQNYYAIQVRYHSTRVLVVNALRRIHQSGIKHCDIASRNIIISKYNNGSIRIVFIDFGASEEHDCPYSGGKIELYSKEPLLDEFKCRELYDVCCEAEVWRKGMSYDFSPMVSLLLTKSDSISICGLVWPACSNRAGFDSRGIDQKREDAAEGRCFPGGRIPVCQVDIAGFPRVNRAESSSRRKMGLTF